MAKILRPAFLHAFRFDGIISSICSQCHVTVASKPNEIDLRKPEAEHTCASFNLGRIARSHEPDASAALPPVKDWMPVD